MTTPQPARYKVSPLVALINTVVIGVVVFVVVKTTDFPAECFDKASAFIAQLWAQPEPEQNIKAEKFFNRQVASQGAAYKSLEGKSLQLWGKITKIQGNSLSLDGVVECRASVGPSDQPIDAKWSQARVGETVTIQGTLRRGKGENEYLLESSWLTITTAIDAASLLKTDSPGIGSAEMDWARPSSTAGAFKNGDGR
ncbi:MAG: hypothetical protein K8U03_22660 [Planctomycetia bacterium]|nr:hypothetical protein [Planctomycetia bacterium]